MYQAYFGLSDKPFSETPNPQFLFLSDAHRGGLAHLEYNILDGKGFSVLVGEVGTGKTTLCRALIERLDAKRVTVVHIIHTDLDFYEFLREVVEKLGIFSPGKQKWDLLKALNHYLVEAYDQKRKVVLIIDEAQNLKSSVLEGIRMLSNLETSREKLIQIIFVGQPEFLDHILRPNMLPLKQRIAGSFLLRPLTRVETHSYIISRLDRVQTKPSLRFTLGAMDLIYRYSKGTPRLINFLCDCSLIHAFVADSWTVDHRLVQSAYREITGSNGARKPGEREIRHTSGSKEMTRAEDPAWELNRIRVSETTSFENLSNKNISWKREKYFSPGLKSRPKKMVLAVSLALTFAFLIVLAFRVWNPESWVSKMAAPPYQIQIPLAEPEKKISDDSRSAAKRAGDPMDGLNEFKSRQPGAPR